MLLLKGTAIGPYVVLELIGSGGMGEVYRARDGRLERDVAIKVLKPALGEGEGRIRRFEREARLVAQIAHPAVVQVFDTGIHEGSPYLVMELFEGRSLRQRLEEGPLSWRQAREIGVQICRGLSAAHAKGIIHRDLKPENVFLGAGGRVKLLDFGLAKLLEATQADSGSGSQESLLSEVSLVLGTAPYMSPEQVNQEELDPRSDIFTVGILLWEMLSGERPFQGSGPLDVMYAIARRELPEETPRGIPPNLYPLLLRCLEKERRDRFQSAQDLGYALESLGGLGSQEGEASAGRDGFTRRPRKLLRGLREARGAVWILGGLGGAALSLLLVLGLKARGWPPFRPQPQPVFTRMTFRMGEVHTARFSPDGRGVILGTAWDGELPQLYSTQMGTLEEQPLGIRNALLLGVSPAGELAVATEAMRLGAYDSQGTMSRTPLGGIAPKAVKTGVHWADLGPGEQVAVALVTEGRGRLECPVGTLRAEGPGWYSHLRFSPDGRSLAYLEHPVPTRNMGFLCVLDLASGRLERRTRKFDAVWGVAWKGREVWFTASSANDDESALYALDARGRERQVLTHGGSLRLHDIAPDGRLLLAREENHVDLYVSSQGVAPVRNLTWRTATGFSDLSPDGRSLVFADLRGKPGLFDVYLRPTDGGPAMQLGKGDLWSALSPDGAWVATVQRHGTPSLALLPTGPGEVRQLPDHGIQPNAGVAWSRDGRTLLFTGAAAGRATRVYRVTLDGSAPQPVSPEGDFTNFNSGAPSPDGRHYLVHGQGRILMGDLQRPDEAPRPLQGLEPGELVAGWLGREGHLAVYRPGAFPRPFSKLDPLSGLREPWRTLEPAGSTGIVPARFRITPDGGMVLFATYRVQSVLYVVSGVK